MIESWLESSSSFTDSCSTDHKLLVWAIFKLIENRDRLYYRMGSKIHWPDLLMVYKVMWDLREEQMGYPKRIKEKKEELERLKDERMRDVRGLEKEFLSQVLMINKAVHAVSSRSTLTARPL